MASARKTGTNEVISTYGNATRNYTALATWEAATDNDLVTLAQSEVLECYDDAASFNDTILAADAITNASYFRIIRPAAGHGHDGTPNNGFTIANTTDVTTLDCRENYFQAQDILVSSNVTSTADRTIIYVGASNMSAAVGCIVFNSYNSGNFKMRGIYVRSNVVGNKAFAIDCLAHNVGGVSTTANYVGGLLAGGADGDNYMYNCTSTNNKHYGICCELSADLIAKNCCSSSNPNDWVANGTITKTTCTTEDATPTYVDAANDDFHLAAADTVCRGNGTNLSADAIYPFDDDIDKQTINVWDIGFDAYSDKGKFFQMF